MNRLKQSDLKAYREKRLEAQRGECLLCHQALSIENAVLDHDHKTGLVRGVIHRGCNSLLGKCENNHKRYGVKDLAGFLVGAADYLDFIPDEEMYHPSYRTEEEKRLRRNKLAKKRRNKK